MREMGRAAVTGVAQLVVDEEEQTLANASRSEVFRAGEVITIDGSSGRVYRGEAPTRPAGHQEQGFQTLLSWADKYKRMEVCAVASSYDEAVQAYELRGDGVGLFRTGDMFRHRDCLLEFRLFLLSEGREQRAKHLGRVLTVHKTLFEQVFSATHNRCLTVCLLDTPLESFLPAVHKSSHREDIQSLSEHLGVDCDEVERRVGRLREGDSLMNNHGSKGALLWADITTMQAMAFYGAALAAKIDGVVCRAQIAVPGATHDHEADSAITAVLGGTLAVCDDAGHVPGYVKCPVGLVLGTPRGCFRADKMLSPGSTEGPRFLVFDTDQLTETIFGLSRTDSRRIVVSELL
jgi:pyruvate,orthophosphate dikinase